MKRTPMPPRTRPLPRGGKPLARCNPPTRHKPLWAASPDIVSAPAGPVRVKKTAPATDPAQSQPYRRNRQDTGFSAAVKRLIRARAGGGDPEQAACEACGTHLGSHGGQFQHIYARGQGGTRGLLYNSPANGVLLCGTPFTGDHGLCEARDAHMEAMGFWRRRNSTERPGDYPVMLHGKTGGGTVVWLTPDGEYSRSAPETRAA